jgi:hypothetical protein
MKKMFFTISALMFLGGGFYFYSIIVNKSAFNTQATELFSTSKPINKKVDFTKIETLPKPVKEYFYNVLKDKSDYISYMRFKHKGAYKPSLQSDWDSIYGVSYLSCDTPAYVWQGRIPFMVATNRYINTKGSNTITLLDFITYSDKEGFEYNKKEFTTWIAQALLYPTTLLPNKMISWEAVDNTHAKLIATYNNLKVILDVEFKNGLIANISTNSFVGEKGYKKWIVEVGEYQWFSTYKIPANLKYSWKLDNELFNYVNFYITKAEFNTPSIFK